MDGYLACMFMTISIDRIVIRPNECCISITRLLSLCTVLLSFLYSARLLSHECAADWGLWLQGLQLNLWYLSSLKHLNVCRQCPAHWWATTDMQMCSPSWTILAVIDYTSRLHTETAVEDQNYTVLNVICCRTETESCLVTLAWCGRTSGFR